MRSIVIGLLVVAAMAATPATANSFLKPQGKIILFAPEDDQGGGSVPTVARGEQFGVNCGCMGSAALDDVRVVLNLSTDPDQLPTGYKKLLATDQHIEHGALRVRVPDAPGLANHTVDVQVYVLDGKVAHACNAGRVRIT
jgi:hypothetical protein